jgi:hypothetical protein
MSESYHSTSTTSIFSRKLAGAEFTGARKAETAIPVPALVGHTCLQFPTVEVDTEPALGCGARHAGFQVVVGF